MRPPLINNGSSMRARRGSLSELTYLQLSYDPSRSEESAREVIFALNPEWETSEGEVEFIRFKEGITNNVCRSSSDACALRHAKMLIRNYSCSKLVRSDQGILNNKSPGSLCY